MSNILIIGEKPSQVKTFAKTLCQNERNIKKTKYLYLRKGKWNDNDLTFFPLAGHITTIDTKTGFNWGECEPIEIVSNRNALKIKEEKNFKRYIKIEAKNAEELWLATDPDSEGDNIAMEAYNIAIKANPILKNKTYRIWNSSLTRTEILRSFNNLREWDESLALGVQGRRFIDAWVGFAGTREITRAARSIGVLVGKNIFSVGRVQLPILYLIVLRDREIDAFVPQTLYNIYVDVMSETGTKVLTLKHIDSPFSSHENLTAILEELNSIKKGIIDKFTVHNTSSKPPIPLNTTDAIALLSSQMHISAKQGLQLMADLYEHGFLSYPRTDNRRFKDNFPHKEILDKMMNDEHLAGLIAQVKDKKKIRVNGKKEGIEDHDPIHPTGELPSINDKITERHMHAWSYFARYYIGLFMDDLTQERGSVTVKINNHLFGQKYQLIIDKGWTDAIHWKVPKDSAQFSFTQNQEVDIDNLCSESFQTKPPYRWSDAKLIKKLEKDRIGTKSSRPDVIKKLTNRNYITRTRGSYVSTNEGKKIIELLETIWPEMITSQFTRKIEDYMDQVASKKKNYNEIIELTRNKYLELHQRLIKKLPEFKKSLQKTNEKKLIACGGDNCDGVLIKRINTKTRESFYGCSNYPKCRYTRSIHKK